MKKKYLLEKRGKGYMHFIVLEEATVKKLTKDGNKRVVCTLNGEATFHAAIVHKKDIGYLVQVGGSVCRQLSIKAGDTVTATFAVDTSQYQFNMPEELEEVLRTDPEASDIFHGLSAGNQRGLIYLVAQVKSVDKRIDRALAMAAAMKNGVTSPRLVLKKNSA